MLGVGFAAILQAKPELASSPGRSSGAGVADGVILWIALAAVVMPIWLGAVGFGGATSPQATQTAIC